MSMYTIKVYCIYTNVGFSLKWQRNTIKQTALPPQNLILPFLVVFSKRTVDMYAYLIELFMLHVEVYSTMLSLVYYTVL